MDTSSSFPPPVLVVFIVTLVGIIFAVTLSGLRGRHCYFALPVTRRFRLLCSSVASRTLSYPSYRGNEVDYCVTSYYTIPSSLSILWQTLRRLSCDPRLFYGSLSSASVSGYVLRYESISPTCRL